ncbi:hypothetical protein ACSBR1_008192 [Camellia fascicularis]
MLDDMILERRKFLDELAKSFLIESWCKQIEQGLTVRSTEELKQSIEERAFAIKNAEDGVAGLKKRGVLAAKSSGSVEEWLEDQLGHAKHDEVVAIENELSTRKNVVDNVKVALKSLPYADRPMAILQKGSTELEMVGKGNAEVALYWVAYDEELKNAMEFAFGSTFICQTIDVVSELQFSVDVQVLPNFARRENRDILGG